MTLQEQLLKQKAQIAAKLWSIQQKGKNYVSQQMSTPEEKSIFLLFDKGKAPLNHMEDWGLEMNCDQPMGMLVLFWLQYSENSIGSSFIIQYFSSLSLPDS